MEDAALDRLLDMTPTLASASAAPLAADTDSLLLPATAQPATASADTMKGDEEAGDHGDTRMYLPRVILWAVRISNLSRCERACGV